VSSLLARRWLPEAALLFVVVIWSTTWIAMKDALKQIDPLAFMSARFVCIALLAWSLLHVRLHGDRSAARIDRADWARLAAGGLIGYSAYQLCSVFALDRSSVFTISLLVALVPLFTMIMMFARGESLPAYGPHGLALAVLGVIIFLSDKREAGDSFSGAILSLGAAVSFAAYGLINRPLVRKYPPDVLASWQLLIGTIPMIVIGFRSILDQSWSQVTARVWLGIVFVIIFPVYIAYQLWNFGIARRGAAVASSYGLLVPILSAVLAVIFFSEVITWLKIGGAAMAIAGLIVVRIPEGWSPRSAGMGRAIGRAAPAPSEQD
jgi:drug/metabolite transporter (DMT)-like permease